ncbi:MAG: glycosyltransferase family 4 protein [Thermoplasmata archaeon]
MDETKKIKFSMITETNLKYAGGTERTILYYYKFCDKENLDVAVFQTNILDKEKITDKEIIEKFELKNIYTFIYPQFLTNLLVDKKKGISKQEKTIKKDIFLAYSIFIKFIFANIINRKISRKLFESDVLYILSDYQLLYLILPKKLLLRKKKPYVIFGTHNYLPIERRAINRIENKLIEKFTYATHFTSKTIFDLSSVKRNTDFIINSGVDTSAFYPDTKKHEQIRYLFVGRLVAYKGINELLSAWKLFKNKDDCELHIVGTGELEQLIKEKATKNIIYHGQVSDNELSSIYRDCDVLVFPTYGIKHDEYFGLVVIEALASGNYVIISNEMRGIFDYFESMGALEYVPLDPVQIAERMANAYVKIKTLKQNVLNVRAYIEENYDWKSIAKKLSEKVKEIYYSKK